MEILFWEGKRALGLDRWNEFSVRLCVQCPWGFVETSRRLHRSAQCCGFRDPAGEAALLHINRLDLASKGTITLRFQLAPVREPSEPSARLPALEARSRSTLYTI